MERQLSDAAAKDAMHRMIDALEEGDIGCVLVWKSVDDMDSKLEGECFPHDLRTLELMGMLHVAPSLLVSGEDDDEPTDEV